MKYDLSAQMTIVLFKIGPSGVVSLHLIILLFRSFFKFHFWNFILHCFACSFSNSGEESLSISLG